MTNKTGKPYAFAEHDGDDWVIYFDPCLKLDGLYHYSHVKGPCGCEDAEMIVKALIEYNEGKDDET